MLRDGQVVEDRYTVLSTLLELGAATLYRVRDATTEGTLVLEVPWHPVSEVRVAQVRAARDLEHPNLVRTRGVVRSGDLLGFLTDDDPAPPLSKLLTGGKLPVDVADAVARGLIGAVIALHGAGVSPVWPLPDNVYVTLDGRTYLPRLRPLFSTLEAEGVDVHVARYLPPEVIEREGAIDGRADVFALGAILYELACGTKAFDGATVVDVYRKIVTASFAPPRRLSRDLPPRMDRGIIGALVPERDHRVSSPSVLLHEWERFDVPLDPRTPVAATAVAAPAPEAEAVVPPAADGGPVAQVLVAGGAWLTTAPHAAADVLAAFRPGFEALAQLHRRGDVHGRLHPGALVLEGPGSGLAGRKVVQIRPVDASDTDWPGWASPERLAPGGMATARGDVFSLGALLWGAATGRPPPSSDLPPADRTAALTEALADQPPDLRTAILQALSGDVSARQADVLTFGRQLYGAEFGPPPTVAPAPAREEEPTDRGPSMAQVLFDKYKLLFTVLPIVAVVLLGGFGLSLIVNGFHGSAAAALEFEAWNTGDEFLLTLATTREPIVARFAAVGADAGRLDLLADAAENDADRHLRLNKAVAFTDAVVEELSTTSQLSRTQRNEIEVQVQRLRKARDTWLAANADWAEAVDASGQIAITLGRAAPPVVLDEGK